MQFYTFMLLYIKEIECECCLLWMQLALFSLQKLLFEVINKLWYVVLINIYLVSVLSLDAPGQWFITRAVLGNHQLFHWRVDDAMLGSLMWSSICLRKYSLVLTYFYFSSKVLANLLVTAAAHGWSTCSKPISLKNNVKFRKRVLWMKRINWRSFVKELNSDLWEVGGGKKGAPCAWFLSAVQGFCVWWLPGINEHSVVPGAEAHRWGLFCAL